MKFKFFLFVSIAVLFAEHSAWCAVAIEPTPTEARYSLPITSNNAYGSGSSSGNNGAIPLSAVVPPALDQLYGPNSQIALSLVFAEQPYRWDPYNTYNQSEFHWRQDPPTVQPADNAYIELSSAASGGTYGTYKSAALLSAPFQRWQPLNDTDSQSAVDPYREGILRWNNSVVINATQRVLLRLIFKCRVWRAEKHPFPAYLVSYPNDDPRLIGMDRNVISSIYVVVTNKSIWALYKTSTTQSKRRIGIRRSYNEIVDVALEYNAFTNRYTFYVSGEPTWEIEQPGLPAPQDGNTKTDLFGTARPDAAETGGSEFGIAFGTHKCLDESDPWNQTDKTQLVRLSNGPTYFGPSAMFYDNDNMRSNNLWGQTVKMTLIKVVVETASGAVPSTAPSTAYNNNSNNNNNNVAYAPDDDDNDNNNVPAYSSNSGDNYEK